MANYLSLEEAAKKLGISADRLVDLRSQGKVRGFRDGASWKFPEDAVDQLAEDLAGEIDPPSSSDDQMESGDLLMESEGDTSWKSTLASSRWNLQRSFMILKRLIFLPTNQPKAGQVRVVSS